MHNNIELYTQFYTKWSGPLLKPNISMYIERPENMCIWNLRRILTNSSYPYT